MYCNDYSYNDRRYERGGIQLQPQMMKRLVDVAGLEPAARCLLFSKAVLDPTQKEFVTLSPEAFTIREAQDEELCGMPLSKLSRLPN